MQAAAQRNGDGALHATGVASRVFLGSFLCGHGLIAELRMSSWTGAQVVDAVIAEMQWPDQLITAFRKISGPPNGARLADWDLQDALDFMDSDLGDEKETMRAAEYMVGALKKRIASQRAAPAPPSAPADTPPSCPSMIAS